MDGLQTDDVLTRTLFREFPKSTSNENFLLCCADSLNSFFKSSTRSFRNETSDDKVSTSFLFGFLFDLSRFMQTLFRCGVKLDKWNRTACCWFYVRNKDISKIENNFVDWRKIFKPGYVSND